MSNDEVTQQHGENKMTYTNNEITIKVLIGEDTTGYNTHEENLRFINALRSAIEAEYPGANISVEMDKNESSAHWYTSTWDSYHYFNNLYDIEEDLDLIQRRVWEKMEY